jgi:hypothetical protein
VTTRAVFRGLSPRAARKTAVRQKHVLTLRAGVVTENGKSVK